TKFVLGYQFSVRSQKSRRRPFAGTSGFGRGLKANPKAASTEQPARRRANDCSKPALELHSDRDETVRVGRTAKQQAGCLAVPRRPLATDRVSLAEIAPGGSHSVHARPADNKSTSSS